MFDLDGTLHDRASGLRKYASDQFRRLGVVQAAHNRYVQRFVELDGGGLVWKDRVYEVLCGEFELRENPTVADLVR